MANAPKRLQLRQAGETGLLFLAPKGDQTQAVLGGSQPCCGLNLFEPWLAEPHTTVMIPFDDYIIIVCLLNCAQFPSRISEVAQTFDAISWNQFLIGGSGFGEAWLLGTV
jgi:hypothetical protein